jgi:hypothetical protein
MKYKIPENIKEKLKIVSDKQKMYFKLMWPKSGVLYLTSKPGIGKSATLQDLSDKIEFKYIDLRLSMIDETDVGLFPDKIAIDGKNYLDHIIPVWAYESNLQPTIIHFEELNRASKEVRNAALQILLERGIGKDFKFNDFVLMVASGNLGEEDNTEVEEFDDALNGRLIHVRHNLTLPEWINDYANDNIHKVIINFLLSVPDFYYLNKKKDDDDAPKAYPSPRSWTFLSDYITCNYGLDSEINDFIDDIRIISHSYIGLASARFIKFCEEGMNIGLYDVLNNYDKVKDDIKKLGRSKSSELIQSLKKISIEELKDNQIENIHKFINNIGKDEMADYLILLLDISTKKTNKTNKFLENYKDLLVKISYQQDEQRPNSKNKNKNKNYQ